MTVSGESIGENVGDAPNPDGVIIRLMKAPLREKAGFLVLSGNPFESALMRPSVISQESRQRFLSRPGDDDCFECKVVVFDHPEDYHGRLNNPKLDIDESTLLVIRGCGTIGFPGSGEVVNMQPLDSLLKGGVRELPTMGDGRQSGTSASPSILNASPAAFAGGGLAKLRTRDRVRVDIKKRRVDALVETDEWNTRDTSAWDTRPVDATPWQKIYRDHVGQLHTGGCFDFACVFRNVCGTIPRHNH